MRLEHLPKNAAKISLANVQVQQPFYIAVQSVAQQSFIASGLVRGLGGRFERAPPQTSDTSVTPPDDLGPNGAL